MMGNFGGKALTGVKFTCGGVCLGERSIDLTGHLNLLIDAYPETTQSFLPLL
jgi:hypothetical protein